MLLSFSGCLKGQHFTTLCMFEPRMGPDGSADRDIDRSTNFKPIRGPESKAVCLLVVLKSSEKGVQINQI